MATPGFVCVRLLAENTHACSTHTHLNHPLPQTGLLFWFGGSLVNDGKYTFQEMMQAIMAILMGAMGLGQALTDMADVKEGRAGAYTVGVGGFKTESGKARPTSPTSRKGARVHNKGERD